jgi:hypothetical protein
VVLAHWPRWLLKCVVVSVIHGVVVIVHDMVVVNNSEHKGSSRSVCRSVPGLQRTSATAAEEAEAAVKGTHGFPGQGASACSVSALCFTLVTDPSCLAAVERRATPTSGVTKSTTAVTALTGIGVSWASWYQDMQQRHHCSVLPEVAPRAFYFAEAHHLSRRLSLLPAILAPRR